MRSLVNKLHKSAGLTLVEVLVSVAITSVVALTASVPVLDYTKRSKKSTEIQVINFIESDIFYLLSLNSICEANLAGLPAATATNLSSLRRPLPTGGFETIITINEPVHPLSNMFIASIGKQPVVPSGPSEGMLALNFDIRSTVSPELNKVRTFLVKVFMDSSGNIQRCSRSTAQDLALFCDAFGGVLNASNQCINITVNGNSNIQNNLIGESTLSAGTINAAIATAVAGISTNVLNITSNIAAASSINGAQNLMISGSSNVGRLVSTNDICRGGNCRRFTTTNCGSGRYIRRINGNGTATCQNRPW